LPPGLHGADRSVLQVNWRALLKYLLSILGGKTAW
jgi:hypothetical protein